MPPCVSAAYRSSLPPKRRKSSLHFSLGDGWEYGHLDGHVATVEAVVEEWAEDVIRNGTKNDTSPENSHVDPEK